MGNFKSKIRNNSRFQEETIVCLSNFLKQGGKKSKAFNLLLNVPRKLLKKSATVLPPSPPQVFHEVPYYDHVSKGLLQIDEVLKLIEDSKIKIVSFDVFDTLLCRPCVKPDDIFFLVAKQVDSKYGIDFVTLRKGVEFECREKVVNIDYLYSRLGKKAGLSQKAIQKIKEIEMSLEEKLLFPRVDMKKVYDFCVSHKKRIVATSDMYIGGQVLKDILWEKGYSEISEVYVSCDYGQTKFYGGELFKTVLEKEHVTASEILHIGDNRIADFEQPLKLGIESFYYPSVLGQVYANNNLYGKIWPNNLNEFSLGGRLIYGFMFNYFGHLLLENKTDAIYRNAYEFGLLGLAPVILAAMLNVCNDSDIQENYNTIYFASRDGYLPLKVYNTLIEGLGYGIPGKYFYAGRRIYYPAMADSVKDFIDIVVEEPEKMTVFDFIDNFIFDDALKLSITNSLSSEEKSVCRNKEKTWNSIFLRFHDEISSYLKKSKTGLHTYYRNVFNPDEKRHLVFDCGHSGSISVALGDVLENEKFDKLYMMQTDMNKQRDLRNSTKTISLLGDVDSVAKTHIFEECFSPYDDSPKYVDFNGVVHVESEECSLEMKETVTQIHKGVEDFVQAFINLYSDVVKDITIPELKHMSNKMMDTIYLSPCSEAIEFFNKIVFRDIFSWSTSLGYKVADYKSYHSYFEGTGFVKPSNYVELARPRTNDLESLAGSNICIHIHLYYLDLIQEFVYYLKDFPFAFDLVVTSPNDPDRHIVVKQFTALCPNLKQLKFIVCPNVGRDVAPWIVEMRDIQDEYDYICHVHSKKTQYLHEMGEHWRKHLLSNLLSPEKVREIVFTFNENPELGCLAPCPFGDHVDAIWNSTWLFGNTEEYLISLLSQMGVNPEFHRNDLLYSIGTMMWYRPAALKPLFDLGLTYADFPVEPLSEEGSIAHAIEHIINYVCERSSYKLKLYMPTDIQSSPFSRLASK